MAAQVLSEKPLIIPHIRQSVDFTVHDTKWIPKSSRFVVLGATARQTGVLKVYKMKEGKLAEIYSGEKASTLKRGTFDAASITERCLATGDFSGRLSIWDLEEPDVPIFGVMAHEGPGSIIQDIAGCGGLDIGRGPAEIATAGSDGCMHVWDPRQKGRPASSLVPNELEGAPECWSVAFGDAHTSSDRCVISGYDNGDIKMFDLRANQVRWQTCVKSGVCSLEFDRRDIQMNKIVAGLLDSKLRVFDTRTMHPKKGFAFVEQEAQRGTVWAAKHLPQNRDILMSCGGDGKLMLWKYNYPPQRWRECPDEGTESEPVKEGVPGKLSLLQQETVSVQPVITFDWSYDRQGLCLYGCFDQSFSVGLVSRLHNVQ